jgi:hypothetical protein
MPAERRYLFSERATVYELTLALQERLKRELAALKAEALLNRSTLEVVEDFVQRYKLDTPRLDRKSITELPRKQTEIQVPQFTQNRAFFGPGPHFVPATAYSIRIPFTGDPNLFRYSASSFGVHIDAELVDDAIVLTHTAENPGAEAIKRDFDNRMTQIENALQFIREQADQWNARLPGLVQPVIEKRQATIQRDHGLNLGYPTAPAPIETTTPVHTSFANAPNTYDVFLSYASEDKESIARPLFEALTASGVSVWYDEAVLKLGDSLSRKIDEGLARCPHGIIIISPSFLDKQWPRRELAGLVAREVSSDATKILPIWHDLDYATLVQRSPTLADRVAGKSSEGIEALVRKILAVIR